MVSFDKRGRGRTLPIAVSRGGNSALSLNDRWGRIFRSHAFGRIVHTACASDFFLANARNLVQELRVTINQILEPPAKCFAPTSALPMKRTTILLSLSSLLVLAACGSSPPPPPNDKPLDTAKPVETAEQKPAETAAPTYQGKPKLGVFGVDLEGMDTSVKPGADFYKYTGGNWIKNNPIPADRSRWGTFDALREQADGNVRKILDEQAATKHEKGTSAQKASDMYAAYLDTAAIDKKGFAPAKPLLDAIAAAKSTDDIAKIMARADLPTDAPIAMSVTLDQKNPDKYIVEIEQGGLGLPERDFYLNKDKQFVEIREKYEAHVQSTVHLHKY